MTQTKVQIRVEKEDLVRWRAAAHLRQVTLSEWMRRVLNATAQQAIKEDS